MNKVIAYLKQYEEADRRAEELNAEYKKEMELIDSVKSAMDIDGQPKGRNLSKQVEERAIRLADKAAELKEAKQEAINERQKVRDLIFSVKNADQRDVLRERYIEYKQTWEEICVKLHVSWGTVHNKHREGLRAVEEILIAQNLV